MIVAVLWGCAGSPAPAPEAAPPVAAPPAPAKAEKVEAPKMDVQALAKSAIEALVAEHGEAHRASVERGVRQVAALWRQSDGDLTSFVKAHYLADPAVRDQSFARLEQIFEQVEGHLFEAGRELRRPTDLDLGPLLPVDPLLAAFEPSAHLTEDLFQSKIAFVVLLNFPLHSLEEMTANGERWKRRDWAEARLTDRFSSRVPAEVTQEIVATGAAGDLYISEYNIWMFHLVNEAGERLFPKGMRLISHWNLRDELKSNYAQPDGLPKQRMIVKVMERIVTQTIPEVVIDNPRVDWNPFTNAVKPAPADTIEDNAPERVVSTRSDPEPDVRYAKLLAQFSARRKADPYWPKANTAIERAFALERELPEARVRALFVEVMSSPLVPKVAAVIEQRLGRKLEPQDLWYDGFKARQQHSPEELDRITRAKYPNAAAFAKDMPRILRGLGFSAERAKYLSERIEVDASRGAGHAMPALRRGDHPRLRTRIGEKGMDYKGYNIAIHELGHNVEQVFSLYDVDHTLLAGVPNNAFTEALAFVFQARDLELLGLSKPSKEAERMRVLSDFWSTFEIAGVALVDTAVWHWMYEHPSATPAELREATARIAQEYWDKYYAPVLGGEGSVLLGVYSHMIAYPLYLPNYPLGHLIAFQIEAQIQKTKKLGPEFERMSSYGRVIPDLWMKHASGKPVSAEPLLAATAAAL